MGREAQLMQPPRLILASTSPRRRELLTQAGFIFKVLPADIDESLMADENPIAYVQRLALEKAKAIHVHYPGAVVLAADTTVVLNGRVLGKPADLIDAEKMLRSLAGGVHQVHTGIAVVAGSAMRQHVETTDVFFSEIREADLKAYLSTCDSLDKAGGYGIQGYAARWITRIEGDYFNVVGLPIAATVRMLAGI